MANISTIFKGIHRDTHEGVCPDGECMQLLNVTVEEDGLYAIPNAVSQATLDGLYTHIVKHEHAGRYLAINEDGNLVDLGTLDGSATVVYNGAISGFQIVGNIVCCFTSQGIYYILYKNNTYNKIGYKPKYPNVIVDDIETKMYQNRAFGPTYDDRETSESKIEAEARKMSSDDLFKAISSAYSDCAFIDRTFFRAAYRLFDGRYICASPIYCVQANTPVNSKHVGRSVSDVEYIILCRDSCNFHAGHTTYREDHSIFYEHYCNLAAFIPTIRIDKPDLSKWEGLIAGIDVFTTGSIARHEYDASVNEEGDEEVYWKYLDNESYRRKIDDNLVFRLYKSYDINGEELYSVSNTSMDNLQVQELLTNVEPSSEIVVGADSPSLVYNSRLHISNYTELLGDAYVPSEYMLCDGMQDKSLYSYITDSSGSTWYRCPSLDNILTSGSRYGFAVWYGWIRRQRSGLQIAYTTRTTFDTDNLSVHSIRGDIAGSHDGESTSKYGGDSLFQADSSTVLQVSNFTAVTITPSSELRTLSTSLTVWSTYMTSEGERKKSTQADIPSLLFSDQYQGGIMVSSPDYRVGSIHISNGNNSRTYQLKSDASSNTAYQYVSSNNATSSSSNTENDTIVKNNILKVSGLENPMSFPPDQTYTPDQSAIKGISANTEELGEGQHGENPLYVFTENATYALYVDKTGKTVYPQIDLVSGDVLSGDSISTTDGVLFITKQGIVLLQGKRKTILSKALDGEDSYILPHNTSDGDAMVRKICAASSLSDECERSVQFREYIEDAGCRLGYDYPYSLIYVSNPNYAYTYVYNLRSGEWSKVARCIKSFLRVYPKCWYVDGSAWENGATHIYDTFNLEISNTDIVVVTRPIKIQRGLKKLKQFLLDGRIRQAQNALTFDDTHGYTSPIYFEGQQLSYSRVMGIYILGSNDGFSYQIASYRETHTPTNCLISHFNRSNAYRYFIICIIGGMRTNTILNGVTFDADAAFSNRLR